jgi:hypothetical protein
MKPRVEHPCPGPLPSLSLPDETPSAQVMSARKSDHIEGEGASRTVGDMLVQTFEVFENQR